MTTDMMRILTLENMATDLFQNVAGNLSKKVKSVQLMSDDNFVHRRDRTSNDIHLYLELLQGGFLHVRSYTRHMMTQHDKVNEGMIFLTAYRKNSIELVGGTHSLRQDWYKCDPNIVSYEITSQNPDLF